MKAIRLVHWVAAVPAILYFGAAMGQTPPTDFPSKPVTLVIPYAGDDTVSLELRLYVQSIQESTGKRFVIDQRGGAGTTIGTAYVAKAAPDGYTALGVNAPFTISP